MVSVLTYSFYVTASANDLRATLAGLRSNVSC
jgi:hypothetical protein